MKENCYSRLNRSRRDFCDASNLMLFLCTNSYGRDVIFQSHALLPDKRRTRTNNGDTKVVVEIAKNFI